MICFQIVSLRYWAQPNFLNIIQVIRCDLLSNCIFEILSTTELNLLRHGPLLWFAFKLYLWDIEHNENILKYCRDRVVICFQIVSLRYWAQQKLTASMSIWSCDLLSNCIFEILSTTLTILDTGYFGCDLLSNCIFEILSTTYQIKSPESSELWFAFKLYLWDIEHNGHYGIY